ncbi:hypothetical protein GS506_16940, partial [Rhodococcus hoagii]|nr:hypothetical protein [Prescottella equi]
MPPRPWWPRRAGTGSTSWRCACRIVARTRCSTGGNARARRCRVIGVDKKSWDDPPRRRPKPSEPRRVRLPRRGSQIDETRRGIVLAWLAFTVTFGGARLVT